ncbi:hypothetical protein BDR26DRAFT_910586 [Obelidium mucronatum]|nr:hypothetical protein BDR26DRAFT_910586 [Obelidium mucronatum]
MIRLGLNVKAPSQDSTRLTATLASSSNKLKPETDVTIVSVNGQLYCIESVCPHSGGPLQKGPIESHHDDNDIEDLDSSTAACRDPFIVCPWHSFRFNLKTGECDHGNEKGHEAITFTVHVDEKDQLVLLVPLELGLDTVVSVHEFSVKPKKNTMTTLRNRPEINGDQRDDDDSTPSRWSLVDWSIRVLNEPNPTLKVQLTFHVWKLWNKGLITEIGSGTPPAEPARDTTLAKVDYTKSKNRGKGGSLSSRIAILHSLASIEQWAIDLAFDIIAAFRNNKSQPNTQSPPVNFSTTFSKSQTTKPNISHILVTRLQDLGSYFGALPVHAALWESAEKTSGDLLARLAVVHMVHEARGLDVNPQTISRFEKAGDSESVIKLTEIHEDEVTHVAAGQRWFSWICEVEGRERYSTFHELVRLHFRGLLKPPFNEEDRAKAGLDLQFYIPLSVVADGANE